MTLKVIQGYWKWCDSIGHKAASSLYALKARGLQGKALWGETGYPNCSSNLCKSLLDRIFSDECGMIHQNLKLIHLLHGTTLFENILVHVSMKAPGLYSFIVIVCQYHISSTSVACCFGIR